jgi:glycosyltransferase involved in cell wall biosynthesis
LSASLLPASVCIIACNEERNLPRCLASVAWVEDRVVIVDARSGDATEAIAREMGARVLVHPYAGNVEQKNLALSHAKHDWVISLDADEALLPAVCEEIRGAIAADGRGADGFRLNRVTRHLGRWIRHGDFFPDWQLRVFRRSRGRWEGTNPHGRVVVPGRVERLAGEFAHFSYRDLSDQVERIQEFSRVQAAALYAAGRRAGFGDLFLRPGARFLRAYLLKQGFRDGVPGFVIAFATAFHVFLKYAKLWEIVHVGAGDEPAAGKTRAAP